MLLQIYGKIVYSVMGGVSMKTFKSDFKENKGCFVVEVIIAASILFL